MPSLGGLLKKKRSTKDSNTSSNNPNSPSSPIAEAAASPVITEEPVAVENSQTVASDPQPQSNNKDSRPADANKYQTRSHMNRTVSHPTVSTAASNHPQQHQNVASINNIINPPQQGAEAGRATGQMQQQAAKTQVRNLKGKYSLEDFTLQRTLGTGSFGRVHLVQSRHNHRFYAIKVLKKAQVVKMKQVEHTNDERRMLQRVRHPFLITLWGTFQDSKNLYMVMDFVEGGELFSLLRKSQVGGIAFVSRPVLTRSSGFRTQLLNSMLPK